MRWREDQELSLEIINILSEIELTMSSLDVSSLKTPFYKFLLELNFFF